MSRGRGRRYSSHDRRNGTRHETEQSLIDDTQVPGLALNDTGRDCQTPIQRVHVVGEGHHSVGVSGHACRKRGLLIGQTLQRGRSRGIPPLQKLNRAVRGGEVGVEGAKSSGQVLADLREFGLSGLLSLSVSVHAPLQGVQGAGQVGVLGLQCSHRLLQANQPVVLQGV